MIIYSSKIYEKLMLSPLEKYSKYGRFPFKMCIHVFLVLLTTAQILYTSSTLATNSMQQYNQWLGLFFREESNTNVRNASFENKVQYYSTIDKFQNHLIKMF